MVPPQAVTFLMVHSWAIIILVGSLSNYDDDHNDDLKN